MRLGLCLLLSLAVLAACQSLPPDEAQAPLVKLKSGTRLMLTAPLAVPPARNRLYFQYGHPVVATELDVTRPHCVLKAAVTRTVPWEVDESDFVIAKTRRANERLADGTLVRTVVLVLHSRQYPEIKEIRCGRAKTDTPITIGDWRAAMGRYFRLR